MQPWVTDQLRNHVPYQPSKNLIIAIGSYVKL